MRPPHNQDTLSSPEVVELEGILTLTAICVLVGGNIIFITVPKFPSPKCPRNLRSSARNLYFCKDQQQLNNNNNNNKYLPCLL